MYKQVVEASSYDQRGTNLVAGDCNTELARETLQYDPKTAKIY